MTEYRFTFDELGALIASPDFTRANSERAALERDAMLTPAESLVRARASYAHRIHGTTWDELTNR
jgi:hypothetical protein